MEKIIPEKKHKRVAIWIIILVVLCVSIIVFCYINRFSQGTKDYNNAIQKYNEAARNYNKLAEHTSVENIQGMYADIPELPMCALDFRALVSSVFAGNNIRKIESDIHTVDDLTNSIINEMKIIEQVTNPDPSWVLSRVESFQGLSDIGLVTEANDPNKMLGKDGGYTGCIYFSLSEISGVDGKDAIEKGTDGGGAIEIYSSLEDAEKRCEYLSNYEGTVLYSGSYAIVGTMVIRVSYKLKAEEQFRITSSLTYLLTQLDKEEN